MTGWGVFTYRIFPPPVRSNVGREFNTNLGAHSQTDTDTDREMFVSNPFYAIF